jgi:hypothetical protein
MDASDASRGVLFARLLRGVTSDLRFASPGFPCIFSFPFFLDGTVPRSASDFPYFRPAFTIPIHPAAVQEE